MEIWNFGFIFTTRNFNGHVDIHMIHMYTGLQSMYTIYIGFSFCVACLSSKLGSRFFKKKKFGFTRTTKIFQHEHILLIFRMYIEMQSTCTRRSTCTHDVHMLHDIQSLVTKLGEWRTNCTLRCFLVQES